ncbi:hypothetical protein ACF1BA_13470 [Streptomyces rubiginosohelvolus]|uniref:hypothetical protein n=1 Tax=Streptomyces rubiginosohelvolus TaxID=67362 RepID=UPI0036FB0470
MSEVRHSVPVALARLAATVDNRPLVVDDFNLAWISSASRAAGGRPSFAVMEQGVAALQRRYRSSSTSPMPWTA